jgi:hypothetical protein
MSEENKMSKLATALCKAQGIMGGAKKDKNNPFYKSKYADLASVFDVIKDPFADNGLAISQTMDVLENGRTVLKTILLHASGEFLESRMILPEISDPQKLGSAITYFRRFGLMAIAGIPAEDDDGNAATRETKKKLDFITPKQVSSLEELINGNTAIRNLVLDNCNGDLSTLTVQRYPGAVKWIKELIEKETQND